MLHKNILCFYRKNDNRKERKYCLYVAIQRRVDLTPSANLEFFLFSWPLHLLRRTKAGDIHLSVIFLHVAH